LQIVSKILADFDGHCSLNESSGATRPWKKLPSSMDDIDGQIYPFAQHELGSASIQMFKIGIAINTYGGSTRGSWFSDCSA
jgi:hypothetical protein